MKLLTTLVINNILLRQYNININEYLTLYKIFLIKYQLDDILHNFEVDEKYINSLIDKGLLITVLPFDGTEKSKDGTEAGTGNLHHDLTPYDFTAEALKIFNGEDLFVKFYEMYPQAVPDGMGGMRPLRTVGHTTESAKKTQSIWSRVTKNKPYIQQIIIDSLEKELQERERAGTMMYMPNIDTWLRNANWEKWMNIPESDNVKRKNVKKL